MASEPDNSLLAPSGGGVSPSSATDADGESAEDYLGEADDANDPGGDDTPSGLEQEIWLGNACGIDSSIENRFRILRSYGRNRAHPKMKTRTAKLNCGRAKGIPGEGVFGLRHIRDRHMDQFDYRGGLHDMLWDEALDVWARKALGDPDVRKRQATSGHFCYAKKFRHQGADWKDTWVMVWLGETGQRVLTSYPSKSENCKGSEF